MSDHLTGKRVLVLGAETDIGVAVTTAVAEAGASVATVAATSEAEAAFAVQRLARRLSSGERKVIAQAIDATKEAAVRVMVRQVSKELGGLDAVVVLSSSEVTHRIDHERFPRLWRDAQRADLGIRFGVKELQRSGGGKCVTVMPGPTQGASEAKDVTLPWEWKWSSGTTAWTRVESLPANCELVTVWREEKRPSAIATEVVAAIAGEAESG